MQRIRDFFYNVWQLIVIIPKIKLNGSPAFGSFAAQMSLLFFVGDWRFTEAIAPDPDTFYGAGLCHVLMLGAAFWLMLVALIQWNITSPGNENPQLVKPSLDTLTRAGFTYRR